MGSILRKMDAIHGGRLEQDAKYGIGSGSSALCRWFID